MLIGKVQDLDEASGSSCCDDNKAALAEHDHDIAKLYDAVNNISEDTLKQHLAQIRDNGIRFGDKWWIGAQGDYFFVIDIADTSYYRFNPAQNTTL